MSGGCMASSVEARGIATWAFFDCIKVWKVLGCMNLRSCYKSVASKTPSSKPTHTHCYRYTLPPRPLRSASQRTGGGAQNPYDMGKPELSTRQLVSCGMLWPQDLCSQTPLLVSRGPWRLISLRQPPIPCSAMLLSFLIIEYQWYFNVMPSCMYLLTQHCELAFYCTAPRAQMWKGFISDQICCHQLQLDRETLFTGTCTVCS